MTAPPPRVVLDTHALIWSLTAPKRLGKAAARLLQQAEAGRVLALVPAIVLVELALLTEAGRRTPSVREVVALLEEGPLAELPLDARQADEFAALRALRDPFDRMVVAAARVAGARLITADAALHAAAMVPAVWD